MSRKNDITAFLFVTGTVSWSLAYWVVVSESFHKPTYNLKRFPESSIYFFSIWSHFVFCISVCSSLVGTSLLVLLVLVLLLTFFKIPFQSSAALPSLLSPPATATNSPVSPLVFANEAVTCLGPFSSLSIFYANYQGWVINTDTGNHVTLLRPLVTLHTYTHTPHKSTSTPWQIFVYLIWVIEIGHAFKISSVWFIWVIRGCIWQNTWNKGDDIFFCETAKGLTVKGHESHKRLYTY